MENNITYRQPCRTNSLDDLTNMTHSNNRTLLDSTMRSIPDSLLDNSDVINDLNEQVKTLTMQLMSAHQEIENLNVENNRLKCDLQTSSKAINTYKKICQTPERKSKTPLLRSRNTVSQSNMLVATNYIEKQSIEDKEKSVRSQATQTDKYITDILTNVPETVISNRNIINQIYDKQYATLSQEHQCQNLKYKLCIMSGNNIKGNLSIINEVFSDRFDCCHYKFPNCTTKHLLCGIENKLKNFTLEDYCIILLGGNDLKADKNYLDLLNIIKNSLQKVTHTNIIICTPTYIRGAMIHNYRVETFYYLLNRDIQNNEYGYFFDSNLTLSFDMFSYRTGKINNSGMRNIYRRIMENILIDLAQTKDTRSQTLRTDEMQALNSLTINDRSSYDSSDQLFRV